jgi:predicted amidohydrolase YtcJ
MHLLTPLVVTLAIVNARVWTGDVRRPWADAVAIAGDRIAAVGSSAAVRKRVRAGVRVVDAHGAMLVPGFIDAHLHVIDEDFALAFTRGIIAVGSLADLVMVDRDLTRIAPEAIRDARILLTVAGGRIVYERPASE